MRVEENVALAPLTTLGLGGSARRMVTVEREAELAELLAECDARAEPVMVLGGGSNLVVRDGGVAGTVLRLQSARIRIDRIGSRLRVVADAGASWDELVAQLAGVGRGVECLAGIPGQVGAAPIQNIGAYGQEIERTLLSVRAFDRRCGEMRTLERAECRFSYRHSRFKDEPGWIVTQVTFELEADSESDPVRYPELARALGIHLGDTAPSAEVRRTVIDLRRGKGMVVDAHDPDSRSAGSFFVNPILDAESFAALEDRCDEAPPRFEAGPAHPAGPGAVKTSAAWLIERAGFGRGYGEAGRRVGVSRKHALALVNRGGGTAGELLALAEEIVQGVEARFGVRLVPEPVIVGVV
jgi:UDP-N-acetylmuramate dehydrogenase